MAKTLNLTIQPDLLESLTRANAIHAIAELVWNSLDADAHGVHIQTDVDDLGTVNRITVVDNGHGIAYAGADKLFENLGGSPKRYNKFSPGNRILHGKEGRGRILSFTLGSHIEYICRSGSNVSVEEFSAIMDRNNITQCIMSDPRPAPSGAKPGVTVVIRNITPIASSCLQNRGDIETLTQKFAVYHSEYPDFVITINGQALDFDSCIEDSYSETFRVDEEGTGESYQFNVKIIRWAFSCESMVFYCNEQGITYGEAKLSMRAARNLSVYLGSSYIDKLQREDRLNLGQLSPALFDAHERALDVVRKYLLDAAARDAGDFIESLKQEDAYPYHAPPVTDIEKVERQVFDVIAVQVSEHLPVLRRGDADTKRAVLGLVKHALETRPEHFYKILTELLNLPDGKARELAELLGTTSLTVILDTMKEVTDRLRTIHELSLLIFDKTVRKNVLERRHLQKIVVGETWIFGDDYTYGADDVNLKNVLGAYLEHLGRENFEEILKSAGNSELEDDIPDVCLWKQYNRGHAGEFENLVIELKRPTKTIGTKEIEQVVRYAVEVASDSRFPKEKTRWRFILLATKMDRFAQQKCQPRDRKPGHVEAFDNVDVFVKNWGDVLNEASARHQYLKEKLQYSISEDDAGIRLLREKYPNYLPSVSEQQPNATTRKKRKKGP